MSDEIERMAVAMQQSFKDRIAASAEMPFEKTGVSLPSLDIYRVYAVAARAALDERTAK